MTDDFIQFLLCGFSQTLLKSGKTDIKTEFHNIGIDLAPKLLELHEIHQTNDLFSLLKKIKTMLDSLYASKHIINQTEDNMYFIVDNNPVFNRSGAKNPNPLQIIAGIIEGCLKSNFFDYSVIIKDAGDTKHPFKIYYIIKKNK